MQKFAKKLSVVMVALFTMMTLLSYVPAKAAALPTKLDIKMLQDVQPTYKVGERMYFKVNVPSYSGKVEYRATLWDGSEKKIIEVFKAYPYYYKSWQPAGKSEFYVTWICEKPAVYNITLYVRPVGSKLPYAGYVKSSNFTVVANEATISEIADQTATVNEGDAYTLPAQVDAKMSDGSTKKVNVAWTPATVDTKKVGDAVFTGKVEGYSKDVKLTLTVKAVPLAAEFKAVGAKLMKVVFNKPVVDTTKMVITVKRDNVTVNVAKTEWNEAKTEATLTPSYYLQAGEYVATAKYDTQDAITTAKVKVETEKAVKISFVSNNGVISDSAISGADRQGLKATIKIENQYGEDITSKVTQSDLSFSSSKGRLESYDKGLIKLVDGTVVNAAYDYVVDQKVVLTVVHNTAGVVANTTLTVVQSANVGSIEIGAITTDNTTLKDKVVNIGRLESNYNDYYIPLVVKDQYGNELKKAELTDLIIRSSNPHVLKVDENPANLLEIGTNRKPAIRVLQADATRTYGPVVLTVVSTSGKSANATFEVADNPKVDVLTVSQPEQPLKKTVEIQLPFTAVDQFGNALVSASDLATSNTSYGSEVVFNGNTRITVSGAQIKAGVNYSNKNARTLLVKPSEDKVVIMVITATNKVQTLTLNVESKPVPATISGLSSYFKKALEQGQTSTLNASLSRVLLKDQYGDSITLATANASGSNYSVVITAVSDTNKVVYNNDGTFTASSSLYGSDTFKATLHDVVNNKDLDEYVFSVESVRFADITEFGIDDFDKFYVGATSAADGDHDLEYTVYGLKGGVKVQIAQSHVKNAAIAVAGLNATTIGAISVDTVVDTDGTDKTAKLNVLVEGPNGPVTVAKDITYSDAAPVAQLLQVINPATYAEKTDSVFTVSIGSLDNIGPGFSGNSSPIRFYAEDQYVIEVPTLSFIVTNEVNAAGTAKDVVTSISNTGAVTLAAGAVAGDSFSVTVITSNGMTKTIKIFLGE